MSTGPSSQSCRTLNICLVSNIQHDEYHQEYARPAGQDRAVHVVFVRLQRLGGEIQIHSVAALGHPCVGVLRGLRGGHDHGLARLPVFWRRGFMLQRCLQRGD